jgi:hypothetical protein
MFSPDMWLNNPFYRFNTTSPFPLHNYAAPHVKPYIDSHMYRTQHFRRPSKHHRSAFDLDDSDFAEPNLGLDTDSTFTPHRHNPDFEPFKRLSLRVSPRTFQVLRPNELLIVSHSLTHLKIILHSHQRTIRVAVAGDMRLRDVLKQVLPHKHLHDARAYVRSQGGWVEPEAPMKVEDVVELGDFAMNEKEEVEVRIVLGCAKMEKKGGARHGWEREMGRMERMRVF